MGGDVTVPQGGTLNLTCLLEDDRVPFDPKWKKDSNSLPAHVTVVCNVLS